MLTKRVNSFIPHIKSLQCSWLVSKAKESRCKEGMLIKRFKEKQEFIRDGRTVSWGALQYSGVSWAVATPVGMARTGAPGESPFSEYYYFN